MNGKKYRKTGTAILLLIFLLCKPAMAGWEQIRLVPSGEMIGIHVDASGLLVVGIAEVDTADGKRSPAWEAGMRVGDFLLAIGNRSVATIQELRESLSAASGDVTVRFMREGKEMQLTVSPVYDKSGIGELGLWLRSGVSGLGTMTYYDPETDAFGALGHGVSDADTGTLIPLKTGQIGRAQVDVIDIGEKGKPGEAKGSLGLDAPIGQIIRNTDSGVFGRLSGNDAYPRGETAEICLMSELHCGPAQILSDISGTMTAYDVEISRVFPNNEDGHDMLITVTNTELLNLTGGIIQGMSGSPILQDGRLAGAVTHVLVNNPARGYGISIERMLDEAA